MNAILLGAASLGALVAMFTTDPSEHYAKVQPAAVEPTSADRGEMKRMTILDPKSGETTNVSVISFAE